MVVNIKKAIPVEQDFPLDCLPEIIAQSILTLCEGQSLPVQYVAPACLWAVSSLAGNRFTSDFGGKGKNILYMLWCGPVSMGKSPAFKSVCEEPLKDAYTYAKGLYDKEYADHLESLKSKDKGTHLPKPQYFIPIAKEATTEGLISKHRFQPHGIGVYYDEAEIIFSAGNYKGTNDAISFFTMAFSGGRFEQVRADTDKERVIGNININLLMGTQTERLGNIFTADRLSSGFAARFLTTVADYSPLNLDVDPFGAKMKMCVEWTQILERLFYGALNHEPMIEIEILPCGRDSYRKYNRMLLEEANSRILSKAEKYLIGAEAKLSAYLPRLCQVLAILNRPDMPFINEEIVTKAFRLYRYFQQSSIQSITKIQTQADTGLPQELENLYQFLPDEFTAKDAATICSKLGLNHRRFEISIRHKEFGALFRKLGRGTYQKL